MASTPRLYNLLEIQRDHSSIRVHTRQQRKPEGAWHGWHEWPDPDGGKGQVSYFDIRLSRSTINYTVSYSPAK